jgi:hypothetical protein
VTSQTTPNMPKWERTAGRYSIFCVPGVSMIWPAGVTSLITGDVRRELRAARHRGVVGVRTAHGTNLEISDIQNDWTLETEVF